MRASPVARPPGSLIAAPAEVKPPRPLPRPQAPPKPRKADGVLAAVATAHDPNARTPPDPEVIAPLAEVADAAPASATVVLSSPVAGFDGRSEEHTSELPSLMRTSYAVFCLNYNRIYIKSSILLY